MLSTFVFETRSPTEPVVIYSNFFGLDHLLSPRVKSYEIIGAKTCSKVLVCKKLLVQKKRRTMKS